jgi:hypothetical protein
VILTTLLVSLKILKKSSPHCGIFRGEFLELLWVLIVSEGFSVFPGISFEGRLERGFGSCYFCLSLVWPVGAGRGIWYPLYQNRLSMENHSHSGQCPFRETTYIQRVLRRQESLIADNRTSIFSVTGRLHSQEEIRNNEYAFTSWKLAQSKEAN